MHGVCCYRCPIMLTVRQKLFQARLPRVSSLFISSPSRRNHIVVEPATSSSPFNDESNADTTFGQVSNAYDSTAMTRILNIESDPFSDGSGISFGVTARKEFEDMMLPRWQGPEIRGINKFEIRKDSHKTAVRPPRNPPNSPKMQKGSVAMEGLALENEIPGSGSRR